MGSKDKEVIARYFYHGKKFEVLVYADKAWALKRGEKVDIREVAVGDIIYYDVRRGLKASLDEVRKALGVKDVHEAIAKIVREGELQLTSKQRKELIEAVKRQIIEFLSRNAIDPRTGLPHPPTRIELALDQAKPPIDPFKPVEVQIPEVIKKLRVVLPLKIARLRVALKIPPQYVGKAYGVLSKLGKVLMSNYLSDGSLSMELEIPAGLQEALIEKVNSLTRGSGEVKVISREYV